MFGTATGANGFQSCVGFVVINEIFHLGAPCFVRDTAPAAGGCVLSPLPKCPVAVVDADAAVPVRGDVVIYGTSSWHPPILLIHHFLV